MDKIIDVAKHFSDSKVGFIISLQEYAESFAKISALNLPNIKMETWVP